MPSYFNGGLDVTEWVLYAFWLFFFGLILYLRREDRREGYPLEDDVTGQKEAGYGLFFFASPKTFRLHNGSVVQKPNAARDTHELAVMRTAPWAGSPLVPTGDPMTAGVGPGAYAHRAKEPDRMHDGTPLITPLRATPGYSLHKGDPDPRGMAVVGADNAVAGTVKDVWVDRAEYLIRFLEVELSGGGTVLLPMTIADVQRYRRRVKVYAILAKHFANVPRIAKPDEVTLDEEERIMAYYGAGALYATPARAEPWL